MPDLKKVLEEYVATANNPKYNSDFAVINSKFPELKNYDKKLLEEYVATANNEQYGSDFNIINSKFPEFFKSSPEKKNPNTPTASSGMGVSLAGKGSARSVLGDYGISTKPKQKESVKGVPVSIASPTLQKESNVNAKEKFSNFNDLNKQVVDTVSRVEANRQKDIASMTGGAKGLLEKANDVIVETLVSGTSSVLSGVAGLVGSAADLAINKTPQKKAPFLSNEWFHSKIPIIQQGEVADPAWWSNQGIRNKMMSLSENLSKISTGELGVAKTEIGLENSTKSSIDYIIEGDYKNGAKSALVDIGQQIPQLVAMAMSGGGTATLGVMGASSAGSNLAQQYQQDGDISVLDFAQGASVGIAEALSEKVFNLDIKALGKVGGKVADFLGDSGKALQKQIQEEGVDIVKDKLIRSFGSALKEGGIGAGQEILEENIVTTVDYLTKALDEDVLNKKGFEEFTKELGQNMIVAGPTGGGASLLAATASLKPLTKEEKVKIGQYQQVLNNENSSKEVKQIAKQRIDAINNGSNTESEALYDQVMTLPIEDRVQVIDKLNTIKKIEAEAESLPLELKEDAAQTVAQLREQVNFALNPKEAEIQGDNRGVEAVIETTNSMVEKSMPQVQNIEARMNNAELIDEAEIKSTTDGLYNLLDQVEQLEVKDEVKYGMITAIEEKIKKIEGYEFETTTESSEPGQTKAVSRGVKIIGTTTRGSKSKNTVTGERLNKKSVTAVDGTTGETMDGEFVFVDGNLEVIDRKAGTSKVFDTGRLEYTDTNLDEDGIVQSITLSDNTTGDTFTINDPEIALDLSIQEKTKQLGEITDGILEEVIQEVEVAPVVKTTIKNKAIPVNTPKAPISTNTTIPTAPPKTTPFVTPASSGSNPQKSAADASAKMYQDSEQAILAAGKKNWWSLFKKFTGNRKTDIERVITATEKGRFANAAVENVSGSMSYADEQFMDARKRLYADFIMKIDKRLGKLSVSVNKAITDIGYEKKQALDEVIFHRRVINIDSNYDKKNAKLDKEIAALEAKKRSTTGTLAKAKVSDEIKKLKGQKETRIKHPRGFNKEVSSDALEGIKQRVGKEEFDDIMKRADIYFEIRAEITEKMVESGLISKDTAYNLLGDEYVERRFLEYILEDGKRPGQPSALSSAQIKALSEGSEGLVLMDSEVLLHAAYRAIENRVAQNRANKALAEAVAEQKFDKSVVIPAEFAKNLNGKPKLDKYGQRVLLSAPNGFTLIPFYENGEKSGVFMRNEEANQWNDTVKLQLVIGDINIDSALKKGSGTTILKFFATLANPLFAVGNVARDFQKVVFLSSTYDTNILTAAPRLLANFGNKVAQYTALKTSGVATDEFRQLVDDYTKYGGKFEFLHRDGKSNNLYKNTLNRKKYQIQRIGGAAYNLFENSMGLPGEISEISMRLAVFEKTRDTLIKNAGGKSAVSEKTMADINLVAANASRAIMDYNKGGLLTKWFDNFSPYLNASVVGFVSDVNYIKKNPKQFAAKMAMFGTNVAAITLYNLMNSDEEDRKNIPDYIKNNNFIFFIPGKNKDGKKEYRLIPKYQGLQPFAAMFEEATEAMYRMYIGKEQKKIGEPADRLLETISTWSPIPMTLRGLMLKLPPAAQAAYAYSSNYDLFRNSTIEYRKDKVPTREEGLDNDKTARIYRVLGDMSSKLGDDFTVSPSRAQNFTEKFITSPTTNFIVGNIYGIADWITQEHQIPREIKEAKPSTVKASVKNKFVREVDPEYLSKFKAKKNTIEKEITAESEFQQKTIKLMVANGESIEKITEFVKGLDVSPEVKVTRLKKAVDLMATKNDAKIVPYYGELMDVKYIDGLTFPTPEEKAAKAFDRFGGVDPKSDDFIEILNSARKLKVLTKGDTEERFLKEYTRLFQKNQPEGKQK